MPKVSVIMSVYREPLEWIDASIKSILVQTYGDFEFLIVNDNPESEELCHFLNEKALSDNRISLIANERNIGLTKSLNVALTKSNGEYIARMDADDIACLNRLSSQVEYLDKNANHSVVHSNYSLIDENGDVIKSKFHSYKDFDMSFLVWNNPIAHSTVMFRNNLVHLRTPLYNEVFRSAQDYELWSFLYMDTDVEVGYIDEVLLKYRHSINQVSRTRNNEQLSNSKIARRLCLMAFMYRIGIVCKDDKFDIKFCFNKLKDVNRKVITPEKEWAFMHALFLLYYNLSNKNIKYAIRYIFDAHGLMKYFGLKQSSFVLAHSFFEKKNWSFFKL